MRATPHNCLKINMKSHNWWVHMGQSPVPQGKRQEAHSLHTSTNRDNLQSILSLNMCDFGLSEELNQPKILKDLGLKLRSFLLKSFLD